MCNGGMIYGRNSGCDAFEVAIQRTCIRDYAVHSKNRFSRQVLFGKAVTEVTDTTNSAFHNLNAYSQAPANLMTLSWNDVP
jgi:hypothetical protein